MDYDEPFYHIVGGTQDNSTQYGPSRTDNNAGIRSSDWEITVFADGHQPAIDPSDPNIVYSEWQEGSLIRWDRQTGEIIYIQPQPEKGEEQGRFNWDSPILISPHDPKTLFFASQRVWRSDDRGDSWTPIDYSKNADEWMKPLVRGEETDLVDIPGSWYLDDLPPMMFIKSAPNSFGFVNPHDIEELWRDQFDWVYRENDYAVFTMTIHPDVSGRPQVLLMLERVFEHIASHAGVRFCTFDEIADDFIRRFPREGSDRPQSVAAE